MDGSAPFQLDLEQPKKNVFVTQLHQREDEDQNANTFPVVKDTGGRLLETGINTLQRTLLIKKEVEVDHVHGELLSKRAEFKQRMDACSERRIDIQKKQQKMKDRVTKFEKFIKDNEAKRRRAIQKYQTEVKLREQKHREYDLLCQQMAELKQRHEYLKNKLAKLKTYELFLNKVLDILPAHYLEVNDSMITSLMMRHRTLSETNHSLLTNLLAMSDQIEDLKGELEELNQEHNKEKLSINSRLSQMQKVQEDTTDINKQQEEAFQQESFGFRAQRAEFGTIMMAIDNIAEKCRRRMDLPVDNIDLAGKLERIQDYLNEREDVAILAAPDAPASPLLESKGTGGQRSRKRVSPKSSRVGFS